MSKKMLLKFEHVIGATVAKSYFKHCGINTTMDELPQEGDAKLYVDEKDYEYALAIYKDWKEDIRKKFEYD